MSFVDVGYFVVYELGDTWFLSLLHFPPPSPCDLCEATKLCCGCSIICVGLGRISVCWADLTPLGGWRGALPAATSGSHGQ